jgi:hypothetical protein
MHMLTDKKMFLSKAVCSMTCVRTKHYNSHSSTFTASPETAITMSPGGASTFPL